MIKRLFSLFFQCWSLFTNSELRLGQLEKQSNTNLNTNLAWWGVEYFIKQKSIAFMLSGKKRFDKLISLFSYWNICCMKILSKIYVFMIWLWNWKQRMCILPKACGKIFLWLKDIKPERWAVYPRVEAFFFFFSVWKAECLWIFLPFLCQVLSTEVVHWRKKTFKLPPLQSSKMWETEGTISNSTGTFWF